MPLEYWQLALLAALGIIAGVLNVIAGGGSLLTLPTMIFMGLPEAVANGTNRVAILAQNVSAVSGFRRKGFSDFKLSLTLALASVPGALLGAHAGALIRGPLFNLILSVVMIGVIILMARKKKPAPAATEIVSNQPLSRSRFLWGHLGMVGVGFYGGFIQAGVGFLLMAVLHNVMKLDLVRVNMHKVFVVGAFT
ncbi:MAG: sulfite exporter TauE/SafE family protein, partial [Verrucomicrobiota bacterium]